MNSIIIILLIFCIIAVIGIGVWYNVDNSNITEFDHWRKKYLGSHVEKPVSTLKPYGSVVDSWAQCKNVLKVDTSVKQVVYNKNDNSCYPMSESSPLDEDDKGGSNYHWISAQTT